MKTVELTQNQETLLKLLLETAKETNRCMGLGEAYDPEYNALEDWKQYDKEPQLEEALDELFTLFGCEER